VCSGDFWLRIPAFVQKRPTVSLFRLNLCVGTLPPFLRVLAAPRKYLMWGRREDVVARVNQRGPTAYRMPLPDHLYVGIEEEIR